MYLDGVSLLNFRNHILFTQKFENPQTIFVAPNGAGKTNILEAIHLLATGETFREAKSEEMVSFDADVAHIAAKLVEGTSNMELGIIKNNASLDPSSPLRSVQDDNNISHSDPESTELKVSLTRGVWQGKRVAKKRLQVNGIGRSRAKFIGNFQVVCFRPEDLRVIEGSPSRRRKFLDGILSQLDSKYMNSLKIYGKALRHRNKVLQQIRDRETSPASLDYWDGLVLEHGSYINEMRQELIESFNQVTSEDGTSNMEHGILYDMIYDHSIMSGERLEKYRSQELSAGYTLVGPHRDDFVLNFEVRTSKFENLQTYGSRGQQRMGVLWLKLQALSYMTSVSKSKPVLLLDDIFSELDHEHRDIVFDLMREHQTIATTADSHYVEGVEADIVTI